MSISLDFNLLSSMFWAFFLGFSLTLGVGVGIMFLAFFQQKLKPKETKDGK